LIVKTLKKPPKRLRVPKGWEKTQIQNYEAPIWPPKEDNVNANGDNGGEIGQQHVIQNVVRKSKKVKKFKKEKKDFGIHLPFARYLGSTELRERNQGFKALKSFLGSVKNLTHIDQLKIWKGLFYALWMTDKLPVQVEIAGKMAAIARELPDKQPLDFLKGLWGIMDIQWFKIDRLRMDKYYSLMRFGVAEGFLWLKSRNWNEEDVAEYLNLLEQGPLRPDSPAGIVGHVADVYIHELRKVIDETFPNSLSFKMIEPFIHLMSKVASKVTYARVEKTIFHEILGEAISYKLAWAERVKVRMGEFKPDFHLIAKALQKAVKNSETVGHRKEMSALATRFLKKEKENKNGDDEDSNDAMEEDQAEHGATEDIDDQAEDPQDEEDEDDDVDLEELLNTEFDEDDDDNDQDFELSQNEDYNMDEDSEINEEEVELEDDEEDEEEEEYYEEEEDEEDYEEDEEDEEDDDQSIEWTVEDNEIDESFEEDKSFTKEEMAEIEHILRKSIEKVKNDLKDSEPQGKKQKVQHTQESVKSQKPAKGDQSVAIEKPKENKKPQVPTTPKPIQIKEPSKGILSKSPPSGGKKSVRIMLENSRIKKFRKRNPPMVVASSPEISPKIVKIKSKKRNNN